MEHNIKLILNKYVPIAFKNKICKYCYTRVVQYNVGEVVFLALELYQLWTKSHASSLILSKNTPLGSINTIYNYFHDLVIF